MVFFHLVLFVLFMYFVYFRLLVFLVLFVFFVLLRLFVLLVLFVLFDVMSRSGEIKGNIVMEQNSEQKIEQSTKREVSQI